MNSIETQTLKQLEMLGTANVGFRQKVRQENRVLIVTTCGDSGTAAGMGGTGSRV